MPDKILRLKNPIMPYAWGSRKALAEFLNLKDASSQPRAELWMGAHPKAPSQALFDGRWHKLDDMIRSYPVQILGHEVADRYDNQLPYLFKVLAAGQPLSIQAHPDKTQSAQGFARENSLGIALSAAERNYKDDNHKPECICAVTPFWGVCGFRPLSDMIPLLKAVWPADRMADLTVLTQDAAPDGIRRFFQMIMTLPAAYRDQLTQQVVLKAEPLAGQRHEFRWVLRLNQHYPGDIGILAPLLLNLICLQPGEALFLPARRLHAYFDGLGMEIMANSDNVLRGGLTPKHIDVAELLAVLDFNPGRPTILHPREISRGELCYPSEAGEFVLSVIELADGQVLDYQAGNRRSPEILFCAEGPVQIHDPRSSNETLTLEKGESALAPVSAGAYALTGPGKLFKAAVNLTKGETP